MRSTSASFENYSTADSMSKCPAKDFGVKGLTTSSSYVSNSQEDTVMCNDSGG